MLVKAELERDSTLSEACLSKRIALSGPLTLRYAGAPPFSQCASETVMPVSCCRRTDVALLTVCYQQR